MSIRDALNGGQRKASRALPLVALAVVTILAVTIRSGAGPGLLAAATPVPDAVLKQACIEGAAVGSGNDGLAGDCALLLAATDTLRGTETLNWSASLAIASWEGITTGGTPSRVTQLHIDGWNSERQLGREIVLRGTIPPEFGGLSKLERLVLARNRLTGTIPAELGSLPALTVLELYSNQLTGGIPPELGGLASLTVLNVSRNRLSGAIPVELGTLSGLATLWLHHNQLTGAVPASLGDLSNLDRLQLTGNTGLTGCIPAALRTVTSNDLGSLRLSYCTTTTTRSLTTSATGSGRISPLPGTYSYLDGDSVTVAATPDAGWTLTSWGDDCSTTAGTATTCVLTMSADRTASVTFERVPLTLTVTPGDGGAVTHDGNATLYHGDEVTLTAAWNDATHDFGGWGGDCSSATGSVCVLTMDANKAVAAMFTALSATRCSMTNDANCIRAVYIGKPGDYAQVVDIPSSMRLSGGPGGAYHVDAGLEVTVVTAARLPSGWTRFYLDRSPPTDPPVSFSQLIKPIGTTYTFTVSEEATAATTITYELKQAKPFVRPRPDGKPHIGATVVETEFEVQDCSSGIAVTSPTTNTELVADCESLLGLRDTIRGSGALNWTAGKAMSDWMRVTVSATPQRVTSLDLSDLGLDGELSGLLGNLTGLTTLDLSGNDLTGMLPSKLGQLTSLTSISLSESSFTGCAPSTLTTPSGLAVCDPPGSLEDTALDVPVPGGTYETDSDQGVLVFDIPADSGLIFEGVQYASAPLEGEAQQHGDFGLIFTNAEKTLRFAIDVHMAGEYPRRYANNFTRTGTATGYTRAEYDAIFDRIVESMWVRADE